jgi:hypothetical protein
VAAGARVRMEDEGYGGRVILAREVLAFDAADGAWQNDFGHEIPEWAEWVFEYLTTEVGFPTCGSSPFEGLIGGGF